MKKPKKGLTFISIGAAILTYAALPPDCPEPARRTAAVFVLSAFFWAFEVIPLFATSLLIIPLLIILLPEPAGGSGFQTFLLPLSNPVIMLFLGGFVLARMVQKYQLDKILMGRLMPYFGDRPYRILCGFIAVTAFVSLWMSHTASTALMLVIAFPVIAALDADDPFKKALVLAIPFAANIGGIGTPVGTPPNAIAVGLLAERGISVNFLSWMIMAVPLAVILLFWASLVLYRMFPPKHKRLVIAIEKPAALSGRAKGAVAIAFFTIGMWLTTGWHHVPESVVSLIAVGAFAALGFLHREDLGHIHWDILILMWGGLALGKAVETSGMGEWVVSLPLFSQQGFALVAAICIITVVLSIFISNTATANLMIPLVLSIPGESPLLLAVMVALASSFDMVLPISTPSNALAFSTNAISARDMFRSGAVIIVVAIALLLAGYPFFITKILSA